ncbi:glycosyltransferase [Natrinema ejinorense]|uniref:Glycosyl transferase n=1 Tax=Natrinema ejinorense TaxID=373386 RepID=A0A2A5QXR9_9EURY|nr:glycosyltransferase family 2 protein [Natrinema ejinorense]PCR91658.1 glycosyl transferase [Natrinema ejinorense]
MTEPPPTSVLLPTCEPAPVVRELAAQLRAADELLVICDSDDDPVARRDGDLPASVDVVVAGEPAGCSGKANAIAAGMEAARHDRLVWTDDDFHHPPDWLERLHADYDRNGPSSELPFFVGRDPLAVLLEPVYALAGTAGTYAGDVAWGGSVIFERDDLPDEDRFRRDLRRTVSDDGLLTDRVDITPVKRVRRVEIGGATRATIERHVRFIQIVRYHAPVETTVNAVVATVAAIGCLLVPVPAIVAVTALLTGVYAAFGLRRWTFLLAYPALLLSVPLLAYGVLRRTFVWGGRRYRWRDKFDVDVSER